MRVGAVVAAAWLSLLGGHGALAAPAADGAQAIYDKAQADYDAERWAPAADGFAALLPKDATRPLKRSQAVMAYRYADALVHLDRIDEARGWAARALPTLKGDADPRIAADAYQVEGGAERLAYDDDAAVAAYDAADALIAGQGYSELLVTIRLGLAYADATRDPAHVLARLQALAADPGFAKDGRSVRAVVEDQEARAALNLGDLAAAKRFADQAVADGGGLTSRANLAQVAARADAGVIAHLRKDFEAERLYFTYTGAGHQEDLSWIGAHVGDLPTCGEEPGAVHPQDFAIVAFAIADDGRVLSATPVYASRTGDIGRTFAQAVAGWSWKPSVIGKVKPFWRASLQLGLRCVARPAVAGLMSPAEAQVTAWLQAHDLLTPGEAAFAAKGGLLDVSSADPRLSRPGGAVLAAAAAPVRTSLIDERWRALDAAGAPTAAYTLLLERYADAEQASGGEGAWGASAAANGLSRWLPRLRERFPGDPLALAVELDRGLLLQEAHRYADATLSFQTVADAPGLGPDDPLRAVALLHLAISLDRTGQGEAARRSLERSGLNRSQCSLFDTYPLARNRQIGSEAFPQEALRWNFEGYVSTDFDIADDGSVDKVRAIISYPPFIFEPTTVQAVGRFRYEPPRLAGRVVGCEGERQTVQYRIGGR